VFARSGDDAVSGFGSFRNHHATTQRAAHGAEGRGVRPRLLLARLPAVLQGAQAQQAMVEGEDREQPQT